jgi:hypothetical protein
MQRRGYATRELTHEALRHVNGLSDEGPTRLGGTWNRSRLSATFYALGYSFPVGVPGGGRSVVHKPSLRPIRAPHVVTYAEGIDGVRTLSLDERFTVLFGVSDSQVFHAIGQGDSIDILLAHVEDGEDMTRCQPTTARPELDRLLQSFRTIPEMEKEYHARSGMMRCPRHRLTTNGRESNTTPGRQSRPWYDPDVLPLW